MNSTRILGKLNIKVVVMGIKKSALPESAISQLRESLVRPAPIIDLTEAFGVRDGVLLALDSSNTVSGTHKGWSYASMFLEGIESGKIRPDTRIVEFTSGRGGEAAARISKLLGLEANIIMPAGITPEREAVLNRDSNLILTPSELWIGGAIARANQILQEDPEHTFLINQSANPNNPTGIQSAVRASLNELTKQPDYIVSTIGTGGTTVAIGRARYHRTQNVGVEPVQSPSTSMFIAGTYSTFKHSPHQLWGGGAGAASPLIQANADTIDRVELMDWQVALEFTKWANTERGLNIGLSTGGNFVVANRLFAENPGSTVMVVMHDTPEVYRSMGL